MKILQVHNFYQQRGGEDAVVEAENRLLSSHGHHIRLFSVTNVSIAGFLEKVGTAVNICYSPEWRKKLGEEIEQFRPDVVHFHNFFPRITPAGYDACRAAGVPVVQTLHNFRLICPGAYLMRNGKICEKCLPDWPYLSVLHRCYRNSAVGTWTVARMLAYHRRRRTWEEKVDAFIAITNFARKKFIEAGFPKSRLHVKPNCILRTDPVPNHQQRAGGLFVGRLSPEKGISHLLDAWRMMPFPLKIVGSGPLKNLVEKDRCALLDPVGELPPEGVAAAMAGASFIVVPSLWYEGGSPMVVVEAFAAGLPVIASRLGSMAESVTHGRTGLHFSPGDSADLARTIRWAIDHPHALAKMGEYAREEFIRKYLPETNYQQLIDIYNSAIGGATCTGGEAAGWL